MSDHDSFGSFLLGFIAGGVAGAIATVLYAPKSGEETRNALREKKEELWEKANLSVDEAYKQAEIATKDAREKFESFANTTIAKADEVSQKGQALFDDNKDKILKSIKKAADDADIEIPTSN